MSETTEKTVIKLVKEVKDVNKRIEALEREMRTALWVLLEYCDALRPLPGDRIGKEVAAAIATASNRAHLFVGLVGADSVGQTASGRLCNHVD